VEWHRQRETPDSSTRALWKAYQQSSISIAGGNGEENEFCFMRYLVYTSKVSLTCRKIWRHRAGGFTSPSEGRHVTDFYHH
jgi:hypothetical protein